MGLYVKLKLLKSIHLFKNFFKNIYTCNLQYSSFFPFYLLIYFYIHMTKYLKFFYQTYQIKKIYLFHEIKFMLMKCKNVHNKIINKTIYIL